MLFCCILSQIIVFFCIRKGVQESGKIAIFTALAPYFILTVFLIRGLSLEGAFKGIKMLFIPDMAQIFNPFVWVDAANQVIFQMSIGVGVLTLYGSYRHQNADIVKISYQIPLLVSLCGIISALVIFTFLGFISAKTGINISDLKVPFFFIRSADLSLLSLFILVLYFNCHLATFGQFCFIQSWFFSESTLSLDLTMLFPEQLRMKSIFWITNMYSSRRSLLNKLDSLFVFLLRFQELFTHHKLDFTIYTQLISFQQ